jgi:hypothetical protein
VTYEIRSPRSIEQLQIDCQEKLDNDAQERPLKTIDVMPMTELFLDIAERIVALENAVKLRVTHG